MPDTYISIHNDNGNSSKIVESESGEREEYQARSIIQNLLSLSESTRKIQKELEKTKGILSELAMKEGIECVTE